MIVSERVTTENIEIRRKYLKNLGYGRYRGRQNQYLTELRLQQKVIAKNYQNLYENAKFNKKGDGIIPTAQFL